MPNFRKCVAGFMSCLLILTAIPIGAIGQTPAPQGAPEAYTPLSPGDLENLVAPIALYPDSLIAQILGAAQFPYELSDAVVWLKNNSGLKGDALMIAADRESWDPAVKALTQFPAVLDNMVKNMSWASALGEASATQQQDVMAAIQSMRAKAQAAGNLKSGPQITVVQDNPQTIVIQPANPQIVYVPTYNPTVIYGAPVVVPGYTAGDVAAAAVISFGIGIAVGAAINGGCCGWGWGAWGTSWHSHTVVYNRNVYVGNSYWRGGYYGGSRPGYPGYRPGYPGYGGRPPGYAPPVARPPAARPPAARPPVPSQPIARPPVYPPGRPPAGTAPRPTPLPSTGRPATPATRPAANPGRAAARPSTNEMRGYQRPQTGDGAAARPNAFSGSVGGREQSARGNRSLSSSGGAARRRK
jgi:hypothetical protein